MREIFFNVFRPLEPRDTSHLYNDDIALRLKRYQYGSSYVDRLPTYFFEIIDRRNPYREIGRCDLRVGDSAAIQYAGHIGYSVYERYRGHRYAMQASELLLQFAHELGMKQIIITCDPDNIASRRTLELLGGTYLATVKVPKDSPCYAAGDREKCQFVYEPVNYVCQEKDR